MLGRIGSFLQSGRSCHISMTSLKKTQFISQRNFGVYHEGNNPSSIPMDDSSFNAYKWMGINVRKPKDKIEEGKKSEETKRALTPEERREARKERRSSPLMEKLRAHYHLTKPRISLMVMTTAWWGYWLVTDHFIWSDFALLSAGTLALSISASMINQIREIDVDSKMIRTIARPLVTGKISPETAKKLAAAYCIGGAALLAPVSPIACVLGLANVALYGGLYTSMKRKTPLNTEVGAFVGAIPPIMGYFVGLPEGAAWSHDLVALYWPAAVMITWQMQHVMLICMRRSEDYNKSGLVMQCLNDPDLITTRSKGIAWSVISTAIVAIPYFSGWADISNIITIYLWGVYTAFYAKTALSLPLNQPRLLKILLSGYFLLAITIALSLHGKKREDKKFDYLQVTKRRKAVGSTEVAPAAAQ